MQRIDRKSQLSTLAFFATVLVVICHADFYVLANLKNVTDDCWGARAIRFLSGPFAAANVSNFFLLSGYFLGKHVLEKGWWSHAIIKRIKTLVVPYLLLNAIVFMLVVGGESAVQMLHGTALSSTRIGKYMMPFYDGLSKVLGLGLRPEALGNTPYDIPLWYIKALLSFVFFAPISVWALRKSRHAIVAIVLACYVLVATGFGSPVFYRVFMGADIFHFALFAVGIHFSLYPIAIPKLNAKTVIPAAIALWIGIALLFGCSQGVLRQLLHPVNICSGMLALFAIVFSAHVVLPKFLCTTSFFIYVAHLSLLCGFGRIVRALSCDIRGGGGNYCTLCHVHSRGDWDMHISFSFLAPHIPTDIRSFNWR